MSRLGATNPIKVEELECFAELDRISIKKLLSHCTALYIHHTLDEVLIGEPL